MSIHADNHTDSRPAWARFLADEEATRVLGADLAKCLRPGLVIFLDGDLGAGKTTLARALLQALGYQGKVKSPTYTLVEIYVVSNLYLYHFDFYRFNDPEEWQEAGFREYFNDASICLVEWPEKAGGLLPPADIQIALRIAGQGRQAEITTGTEKGRLCLSGWADSAGNQEGGASAPS
ncbi:MAG: tRNA (adenosine(37)-N6)-threonylcarbamoyltransferase complex ATPase subunit type 1 TsaE [Sulfuricella sp.]|nr:tRNA (adenosine(37)-N6)-threonylcarbamoyltransferase complex ATPase subunit type 1 TsaE [Sulfuricella sp.]